MREKRVHVLGASRLLHPSEFNRVKATPYTQPYGTSKMKPTTVDDDFEEAEEENKVINEVRVTSRWLSVPAELSHPSFSRSIKYGLWLISAWSRGTLILALTPRKKNAPYLYDLLITHALDWPSLTCQWFPDKEEYALRSLARSFLNVISPS